MTNPFKNPVRLLAVAALVGGGLCLALARPLPPKLASPVPMTAWLGGGEFPHELIPTDAEAVLTSHSLSLSLLASGVIAFGLAHLSRRHQVKP